jgi:hypothetical protein
MLSAEHHTLNGLLGAILAKIDAVAEEMLEAPPEEKLGAFERALRASRAKGILPVLLVDEFETLTELRGQFGDNLLMSWRSLGSTGQVGFVTASTRPLERVSHEAGLTSPFYNIFSQIDLGEFTEEEARQFATWAVQVGGFDASDGGFIVSVGNQHPLRLQVTAWHLFEERQGGELDFGSIEERVNKEMEVMLGQG